MGLIIPDVWALLEQITKSMDYQGSRTLGYQVSAGVRWGYQERKKYPTCLARTGDLKI